MADRTGNAFGLVVYTCGQNVSINHCVLTMSSWEGLHEQHQRLTDAALEVHDSDAALRQVMPNVEATGRIMMGLRDPSTATTLALKRAVDAQRHLQTICASLVNEHHMDFFFVRSEWARIVDPSDGNVATCDCIRDAARIRNNNM